MGYLAQFTEHSELFSGRRIPCEKYGNFLKNLTRLMDVKHTTLSECGARHSEVMLLFAALDHLSEYGENITVAETARRLNVSMPAVSRSLKALSEKGLIERDLNEKDRRSVRIVVTKEGEKKIQNLLRHVFSILDRALEKFSDDELSRMIELQDRFVNSLITAIQEKGEKYAGNKKHN